MEEDREIKIEVLPDFDDFLRVISWQTFKKLWFILLIALILIPVFIVGVFSMISSGKFNSMIVMPIVPLLIVLLIVYNVYSSARKSVASVKGSIQWIFSEEGFQTFSPVGTSETDWSGIEKISETTDELLLFPQKTFFIIIPKRSFETESEIHKFKELITDKLGHKAKLKK